MSDYDSGREGRQFEGHMDLGEYNRGVRDREEAEAALSALIPKPQQHPVPGVAFTILIIAPFLYLVYPVLGITLLAVFGAVVLLFYYIASRAFFRERQKLGRVSLIMKRC